MIFAPARRICRLVRATRLPPDAETEASAVEALMTVFAAHGCQRAKPRSGW